MNLRVVSFTFKVIKFTLILLLLGLGVHFGLITPRGNYSLDYAGIFGAYYQRVVEVTLLLYFLYRALVLIAKSRFGKQETADKKVSKRKNQNPKKSNIFYGEIILLILVVLPIAIGIGLTRSTVDLSSSTFFQTLRFIMVLAILSSVGIIYTENVDFSNAE